MARHAKASRSPTSRSSRVPSSTRCARIRSSNASVDGETLVVHRAISLGIAVDLDFQGLVVPVVRNADGLRLRALARAINDVATRARAKKLTPDDLAGGTFTVTNPGGSGTWLSFPIINQPQVAIVATDGVSKQVIADERRPARDRAGRPPVPHVRPPRARRCLRGRVPSPRAGDRRDARLEHASSELVQPVSAGGGGLRRRSTGRSAAPSPGCSAPECRPGSRTMYGENAGFGSS